MYFKTILDNTYYCLVFFHCKSFCLFFKKTCPISLPQKQHIMPDTLTFTSVHTIPGTHASAAFTTKTSEVFKEENDIAPIFINERMKYIPWGGDNRMPYNIINLIESDETLSTCQMFNAEVCYGSGLVYNTEQATERVRSEVDDFTSDNDIASYFLGVCQDFKHFGFCVSVIILNEDASRIRLAKGNVFAEWKQSDTAKLFEDYGYKNKKQAGGYFLSEKNA